jgi:DNA-binding transcriptional ArsR family regulator
MNRRETDRSGSTDQTCLENEEEQMNTTTLSALAEPNRLLMVELLRDGPLTVGEIAERLQVRQPQVSKHLKVLNEARIVEVRPVANRRFYRLSPEPLRELDNWLQSFRSLWEERFDHLDAYLEEMQQKNDLQGKQGQTDSP